MSNEFKIEGDTFCKSCRSDLKEEIQEILTDIQLEDKEKKEIAVRCNSLDCQKKNSLTVCLESMTNLYFVENAASTSTSELYS